MWFLRQHHQNYKNHHRNLATEITSLHGRDIWQKFRLLERLRIKIKLRAADLKNFHRAPVFNLRSHSLHIRLVLMMDPDMDSKRRLGHFDTVVSLITSLTYHHRNLATGKGSEPSIWWEAELGTLTFVTKIFFVFPLPNICHASSFHTIDLGGRFLDY